MADQNISNTLPKSKAEAQACGATHYFTGSACKAGHVSRRSAKTGRCLKCGAEETKKRATFRAKYMREYQRAYFTKPEKRTLRNRRARQYQTTPEAKRLRRERRETRRTNLAGRQKPDVCEVCGRTGKIAFDHCHLTGHFRGWICERCNLILGMANDNPLLLRHLADYLANARIKNPQADFISLMEVERALGRT